MKLQKHTAVVTENKTYYRFVVSVPPDLVNKLGWDEGQKLKGDVENNKLVYEVDNGEKIEKITYDVFKNKVKDLLESAEFLTWDEIRKSAKLPIKVPGHHWVNRLKTDIGLEINVTNGKKVWQIPKFEEIFEEDAI